MESKPEEKYRQRCYNCFRPQSSCMCEYITKIDTHTQFIILMHPKEFQKTKNGTGYFTHRSLLNSKLFKGIDFSNNKTINTIINNPNNNCFLLYPTHNSILLNHVNIQNKDKKNVIFIIDSTWPCANKILALSKNIQTLPTISFEHQKSSQFKIKTQPKEYCLSTIESTFCVLELLNNHNIENIEIEKLSSFLKPFEKMVEYQVKCSKETGDVRYKIPYKK